MPYKDKRANRIPNAGKIPRSLKALTKHARTVDDILAKSDVNEVLENVAAEKADIDEILIIYKRHNTDNYSWCASDLEYRECLWMMKSVEFALLSNEEDD